MAIDVYKKQEYLIESGSTSIKVEGANGVKAGANTVPVGKTEMPQNIDSLSKSSSQAEAQKTKRSEEELYNSLAAICKENGINIVDVKNSNLLVIVSGKTIQELLNVEQSEIVKNIDNIKNAIKALKEDKLAINVENIKKYDRVVNKGQLPEGWNSVANFREKQRANREDLAQRLKRVYGCDITKMQPQEIAVYIEKYFHGHFASLKKQGRTKADIERLQLTDFSKLLFNSSEKDVELFKDALKYLVHNNRSKGFTAILENFFTQEQKTQFSNDVTIDEIKEITSGVDDFGQTATDDNRTEFFIAATKERDKEGMDKLNNEHKDSSELFYTDRNIEILKQIKENPSIIAKIEEKKANNEELTEEENEILCVYFDDQWHRGVSSNLMVAAAANKNLTYDERKLVMSDTNNIAYNLSEKVGDESFYRETIEKAQEYIKEHPEVLAMTPEEFARTMDEATNGNFSIVVNDLANNTTTPLNAPAQNTSVEVEANNVSAEPVNNTVIEENIVSKMNAYANDVNEVDTTFNNQNTKQTKELVEKFYKQYNVENETEYVTPTLEKKVPKTMAEVKSVDDYKKFEETSGKGSFQNALEAFSKNIAAPVKEYILGKIANWDSSRLVDFANAVKDNDAKKETGKLITSSSDLGKVKCNNSGVQDFFDTLIEQRKEKEA